MARNGGSGSGSMSGLLIAPTIFLLSLSFLPGLAPAQKVGWNLGAPGASCTQTCGSSLSCVPAAHAAVQDPTAFLAVAGLLGVNSCANGQAQSGGIADQFDPSVAAYMSSNGDACFYAHPDAASTCAASFAGDNGGYGPARRFCCCAASSNDASACGGDNGSGSGGIPDQPEDLDNEDDPDDDPDQVQGCAAGDVLCSVLQVGRTLFDLYLTLCG